MIKLTNVICFFVFLSLTGCAIYTGPLTGKKYNCHIADIAHVQLNLYWQEKIFKNYFDLHPEISEDTKKTIIKILSREGRNIFND